MKHTFYLLVLFILTGCNVNYPLTTFYVKNASDKTVNFKASIEKYSSIGPSPYQMTLPFVVLQHDSVMVRKVNFRKDAQPVKWFTQFIIFPAEGIAFNDPYNNANWVRTTDAKGNPVYTFIIAQ